MKEVSSKHFWLIVILTTLWINASEIFRYFVLVRPKTKSYWNHLEGIADMDVIIFLIWGVWDSILTLFVVLITWVCWKAFDSAREGISYASMLTWVMFVLFWVATANMGFSSWEILWITLPLSLLEMIVGAFIAYRLLEKYRLRPSHI